MQNKKHIIINKMRFENLKNLYYFIIINVSFTLQASY